MTKYQEAKEKALSIIYSYPRTDSGNYFITLKNKKRVFFSIFIKKYGLDGKECKYKDIDVYRRIKIVECFEYLLQHYDVSNEDNESIIIESLFFRFVIKKYYFRSGAMRYELLSFYDI